MTEWNTFDQLGGRGLNVFLIPQKATEGMKGFNVQGLEFNGYMSLQGTFKLL